MEATQLATKRKELLAEAQQSHAVFREVMKKASGKEVGELSEATFVPMPLGGVTITATFEVRGLTPEQRERAGEIRQLMQEVYGTLRWKFGPGILRVDCDPAAPGMFDLLVSW